MSNPLSYLRDIAIKLDVLPLADIVLSDPRFPIWTASSHPNVHHYGRGGLLQHTYEVVTLCMQNHAFFETLGHKIDERALYLAAVWHDYAKLDDYRPDVDPNATLLEGQRVTWTKTPYHSLIHHVHGSAIAWCRAVDKTNSGRDIEQEVLHAILSHHGLPEWGSAVKPRTRIAHLLHLCDNMSACLGHVDTIHLSYKT